MITNEMRDQLIAMARQAAQNAYVPYSHFKVGAAILGEGGGIYTGCNVENASLGLTICAERNACTTMVAQGERRIAAVAIYGGERGGDAAPCGACRQFMLEFADEALEAPLFFAGRDGSFVTSAFREISPSPFRRFAGNDSPAQKNDPPGESSVGFLFGCGVIPSAAG